jgi:hypothetical protein
MTGRLNRWLPLTKTGKSTEGAILTSILYMKKPRHREVNLPRSHRAKIQTQLRTQVLTIILPHFTHFPGIPVLSKLLEGNFSY